MKDEGTLKQLHMCDQASRKLARRYEALMECVNSKENPLTSIQLQKLIEKYPERYKCFEYMVDVLKVKENDEHK